MILAFTKRVVSNRVLHFVACSLLVFLLPLLILRARFQQVLRSFSHIEFELLGHSVPLLPLVEVIVGVTLIFLIRRRITRKRVLAVLAIAALFLFSWMVTDIYLDLSLYDIQANYHYLAYIVIVLMFFRAFAREGRPKHVLIYCAFATCLSISVLDEGFQLVVSDRVFDLNDQAKDALGAVMGLIVVYFVLDRYGGIGFKAMPKGERRLAAHMRDPATALISVVVFTLVFLTVSSLFTAPWYWHIVVLGTALLFALTALVFYMTRLRTGRRIVLWAVVVLLMAQVVSLAVCWNRGIVMHNTWLTVYKGVPIPFCDVLVYPSGAARPVDKHHLSRREIHGVFMGYRPSIILIGANPYGDMSTSIDARRGSFLFWNEPAREYVQIVVTSPDRACALFNRLKQEKKNVMFALHTSCGGFFD